MLAESLYESVYLCLISVVSVCVGLPVKMTTSTAHTDLIKRLMAVKTMHVVSSHISELDSEHEEQDTVMVTPAM